MPNVDPMTAKVGDEVPCVFESGFAEMRDQLEGWATVACVESAHPDPSGNGDIVQGTIELNNRTLGYMSLEQATGTMRWYDGQLVYTYNQCGLQARPDDARFAWELDPSLLQGENSAACQVIAADQLES